MPEEADVNLNIKVQKRNGQIIDFNPARITLAITNSFKAQSGIARESALDPEAMKNVQQVTDCVVAVFKGLGAQRPFFSVEEIQDEVIRQLYENGHKQVAEKYASYRRYHEQLRKLFELYPVIKRDGKVVPFKQEKISSAIAKALIAQNKGVYNEALHERSREISDRVVSEISARWPQGRAINIEEVQDIVERMIIVAGYYEVARRYILYREERAKIRRNRNLAYMEYFI
jgi:ribonucleoside-diphosphate reductase alpha chain